MRKCTLWGTLLAGGQGVEYYFGYSLPENDLQCQNFRSRDKSWDYCRIALRFFREQAIPFWEMRNADELADNPSHDNSRYCFAKPGEVYLLYLPDGRSPNLDLTGASGSFEVKWFDPRNGGPLSNGSIKRVEAGKKVPLGAPPNEPDQDWAVLVRKS